MARPSRNASPEAILSSARTFFVTTKTGQGRLLLQSERNATLGGFSYRLKKYIAANPVKEGVADSPEKFPYCFGHLAKRKAAGAKAL